MKRVSKSLLLAGLGALVVNAASPAAWEMTTYQDFVKGKFTGLALTRDGRVTLAPKLVSLAATDQAAVWSVARATDGTLYLGTGHRGKVFRVDRAGKVEAIWSAGETEVFAVAVDPAGKLYAATSPDGKVYRIDGTAATEYFAPKTKYIWSLAFGKDGALYVGTGDGGKVFRVTGAGQGEVWYETGQANVTSLAIDAQGRVLAGSEPNGIIYQIGGKDKAFVLYDANLPEIRAMVGGPDGSIYAVAMGGSVAKQTAAGGTQPAVSSSVQVTAPATSITVTEEGAAAQQGQIKPQPATGQTQASQPAATAATAVVEMSGVEKSAIYKINSDNTVETVWSSKEENAYDIAWSGKNLLIGTDSAGRIYRLDSRNRTTLITETREGEILRLITAGNDTIAATGEMGKLYRLDAALSESGSFESTIHDATSAARWGRVSWRAEMCGGCKVELRTRTGNSARPDRTWSEWSAALNDANGSAIGSPNARYVQWKAELRGAGGVGPSLDWVRLAYLPQNTPPTVKSVTVSAQTASAGAKTVTAASATPTYSITVTESGEVGASSVSGTATQPLTRASMEQILVSWSGEDVDSDKLVYSLYFRGEDESEWKLLKSATTDTSFTLDAEAFADGRYFFRVTASDRMSNPPQYAREGELTSAPVLVDRTPPAVSATLTGRRAVITVSDAGSPLRAVEYSVDAGPWTPMAADDGVIDSMTETFSLDLESLKPGPHMVVVRAYDSANNAGVKKLAVQ